MSLSSLSMTEIVAYGLFVDVFVAMALCAYATGFATHRAASVMACTIAPILTIVGLAALVVFLP